jgi:hypothetical protein
MIYSPATPKGNVQRNYFDLKILKGFSTSFFMPLTKNITPNNSLKKYIRIISEAINLKDEKGTTSFG